MHRRDRIEASRSGTDERLHPTAPAWRDRVEELLLAGERIRERVTAGEHAVVVTSHRVLVFHPTSADGPRFRAVDRPNAVDVRTETQESFRLLGWALVLSAIGTALALVGVSVDFAGLIPAIEEAGPATGTVQGTIDTLSSVLAAFGQLLVLLGLFVLLAGLVAFGQYLRGRRERLVVAVSGEPALSVPRPAAPERAVAALTRAIEAESVPDRDEGGRVDDAFTASADPGTRLDRD